MPEERTVPFSRPSVGEKEWQALREPLLDGWITQGPRVAAFEKAFARRHGTAHALATTSCTTALHLILAASGIGPGDEVIVPAFTWIATANAVLYCGARPVLADVDGVTYNIDPAAAAAARSRRTKAVLAVHLFGLCADTDALAAAIPGVTVFEDAACAAGSSLRGRPAGSLGRAGAFSFHPRKVISTGEGGMATCHDDDLARRIGEMRSHGAALAEEARHGSDRPWEMPDFPVLGYNYRMTDLQGAVGLVQLARLDDLVAERRHRADYYRRELEGLPWLRLPEEPEGFGHTWQSFVCTVDEERAPLSRDGIMEYLHRRGVGSRPGTHALHMLSYYRTLFAFTDDDFPVARDLHRRSLSLPLYNAMTDEDYRYVVDVLQEAR